MPKMTCKGLGKGDNVIYVDPKNSAQEVKLFIYDALHVYRAVLEPHSGNVKLFLASMQ